MKVKTIKYSRLKSTDFSNEKIGVEIVLKPGDNPTYALKQARLFVAREFGERPDEKKVADAQKVVADAKEFDEAQF